MNVALVGTAYPWRGGIAHYNALLYRHLSARHDVQVVTFTRQYPQILFPGKSQKETSSPDVVIPTTPMIDSLNPVTWIRAARAIAKGNPDLVLFKYWLPFFGPCFGTIARLIRRWSRARVVFICDNVIPHERRIGDRAFTRYAFRPVDHFIVQSGAVQEELRVFWPGASMTFVPHPIYEIFGDSIEKKDARHRLGIQDERVILFFGYVRPYKGLDTLLQALPQVLQHLPLHTLVVGEFYEGKERYEKLIGDLGISGSVHLHADYVPNEDVRIYFSAADVVVLPYRSATQSGIVQIAYQFDRPVIATDVGGLAEVVRHGKTGIIVKPGQPHGLADAIREFYDRNLEESFARNIREEKKRYTWDALVSALEEIADNERPGRAQRVKPGADQ